MAWQNFNWVDYTICVLIVFSTLISFSRGFVKEAISLIVWVGAFWVAYTFYETFATQFLGSIESPGIRAPIAFLILFVAVLIVGAIINHMISLLVYSTGLSGTDRVLGLVFGFARGVLLVAVLVLAASMTEIPKNTWWVHSQLIPKFEGIVSWLRNILPKEFDKLKESALSSVPSKSVSIGSVLNMNQQPTSTQSPSQ